MNDQSAKSGWRRPQAAPQLGHVHLYVGDLERSINFYGQMFELRVTERIGDAMAFLASAQEHHSLALQALGEAARPPAAGSVGLYHVAFEVPSAAALEQALDRLDEHDVRWQAVDHGISWAVYFDDPDGNGLELYVDRRHQPGGRRQWHGATRPLSGERVRQAAQAENRTTTTEQSVNQT